MNRYIQKLMKDDFISYREENYTLEEQELVRSFLVVRRINWDQLIKVIREFYEESGRIEILENTQIEILSNKDQVEIIINDFS